MHNDGEDKKDPILESAFSALREMDVEPSPFLKTRVLAHAREASKKSSFGWLKIFVTASTTALVVAFVSWQVLKNAPIEEGLEVGKPYMVKADLRDFSDNENVSYVKIELDGKVAFSSKKFSKLNEVRSLTLSWEKLLGKQYLPVVVKGTEQGASHVRVYFYDKDNNVIKTQEFDFNFDKG